MEQRLGHLCATPDCLPQQMRADHFRFQQWEQRLTSKLLASKFGMAWSIADHPAQEVAVVRTRAANRQSQENTFVCVCVCVCLCVEEALGPH